MAGTSIDITSNAVNVAKEMRAIADRCGNALPAMRIIGRRVVNSVKTNFYQGGRPNGWQALAPATLAKKKGSMILVDKGKDGLMGSIHAEPKADHVIVGTDTLYAAVHQFGGQAGRGLKTTIPQREFLLLQDGDYQEIKDDLANFILRGL